MLKRKIITVVGARPQFIKLAMVSRVLRKNFNEIIIHTGQHFDYNMSEIFFQEMSIPKPNYNLGISGMSHGKMTGEMISHIEEILMEEKPDGVLLYGDTNSTMAGALAAVKLHIPVFHIEAGNRLGTLDNPEEVNRIVTDHVSTLLFYCTNSAKKFLKKEGLDSKAYLVGDPMYDAFFYYSNIVGENMPEQLVDFDGEKIQIPNEFNYLTCHRQENTYGDKPLLEILSAMEELNCECIYPVHPRNQERVIRLKEDKNFSNIIFCKPVGYLMSIYLVNHSKKIVTDSGGLQREAFFAKKQCVTIFDYVAWPETMIANANQLAKPDREDILKKLNQKIDFYYSGDPFGDGHSAEKIVNSIEKYFCNK